MPGRGWGKGYGCKRFNMEGYRSTLPRQSILDVLEKSKTHLSAEEIFNKVQKECSGVNLTTIYRNLEILVSLGIVLKYDFGDGKARYEYIENPEKNPNHLHLVCKVCGRIIDCPDFLDNYDPKKLNKIMKKYDFEIEEQVHQMRGVCSFCKK